MYKFLLCWRYLRTRYLALACIVSVMLGVATLIVVNSVMSGFSTKLRERLHGLLSDVVLESYGMEGFADPAGKMARIREDPYLGPRVEAMAGTVEVFAMLQYHHRRSGQMVTRPVRLIGVEPKSRSAVGGFADFLYLHGDKKAPASFELPAEARRRLEDLDLWQHDLQQRQARQPPANPDEPPPPKDTPYVPRVPHGAVLGHLIGTFRYEDPVTKETKEEYSVDLGDSVVLTTVNGEKLTPVYDSFVVVSYFKSEMSEYDGNYVFVPLEHLQRLRTMGDRVTSIQIKLKNYAESKQVVARLGELFAGEPIQISTWEQKQGPLLHAIDIEKGILNVLLFMIIAVAGFGILAIFSMIVTEKTRDVGILKALGASNGGVMKIFLGYGLLLGTVGVCFGNGLGIWITNNINWIEQGLSRFTGQHVFDPKIYYFREIPTDIQPAMIVFVNIGALVIAVVFSILPALRAAMLRPVQALRYE